MNKKQVMSMVKKLIASVLAVGMIVAGIVVYPGQVDAAVVEDKVIFEEYQDAATYWTEGKKAPVKEGYVFGGWFKAVTEKADKTDKTETYTDNGTETYYDPLTMVEGAAYAKFVPAQVLSVKAQNSQIKDSETSELVKVDENNIGTISSTNPMYVRVMSSVDSTNYQKVGFEIYLANWLKVYKDGTTLTTETEEPTETTKIYTGLLEGGATRTANAIFGGESEYLSVWQLSAIDTPDNATLIIYVRPYWVTTDGTKVEGLAKYVHIEDDYMGYVSVPINILNKETAAQLAAGQVDMTYTNANDGETVTLTFKEVEAGRLLPEMNASQSGNVIKIVGNETTVDKYKGAEANGAETLYANVRFIKPSVGTTDVDVDFDMDMVQFCDWDENIVTVDEKWDVKYDAP